MQDNADLTNKYDDFIAPFMPKIFEPPLNNTKENLNIFYHRILGTFINRLFLSEWCIISLGKYALRGVNSVCYHI